MNMTPFAYLLRQYSGDDNDYMTVRLVDDDLTFADQFDRTVYSLRP